MAAYMKLHASELLSNFSGLKSVQFNPLFQFVRYKALRRRPLNVLTVEEAENLTRKKSQNIVRDNDKTNRPSFRHRLKTLSNVSVNSNQDHAGRSSIQINQVSDTRNDSFKNMTKFKNNGPIIVSKTDTSLDSISNMSVLAQAQMLKQVQRKKYISKQGLSEVDLKRDKEYLNKRLFTELKVPKHEFDNTDAAEKNYRWLPDSFKYEKVSEGNKQFGPVIMSAKSSKDRGHSQTILLEGKRLIIDAVNTGVNIKSFYFTQIQFLEGIPLEALVEAGTRFYKVKDRHMKVWSDMVTPPGLMCVCAKPKTVVQNIKSSDLLPITLICDNIRDAGQLGSLIRSAAAACCQKVLVTRGSINAWDPRVLRAAAGAHFRVHIIDDVGWENIENYFKPSQETPQFFLVSATRGDLSLGDNHKIDGTIGVTSNSGDEQSITKSTLGRFDLNIREYDSVDYSKGETVVIVNCGEDGRSNHEARKLVYSNNGDVIILPTMNIGRDVKLSQSLTASIILFEIKRQKITSSVNIAVKDTI